MSVKNTLLQFGLGLLGNRVSDKISNKELNMAVKERDIIIKNLNSRIDNIEKQAALQLCGPDFNKTFTDIEIDNMVSVAGLYLINKGWIIDGDFDDAIATALRSLNRS